MPTNRPPVEEVYWDNQPQPDEAENPILAPRSGFGRAKTPSRETPPHVKRGVPQTPRKAGISNQAIVYKDPAYERKLNSEMDPKYAQLTFTEFLNAVVPGPNIPPADLKKLKSLQGLNKLPAEKDMYPVIVSFSSDVRYFTASKMHCSARRSAAY